MTKNTHKNTKQTYPLMDCWDLALAINVDEDLRPMTRVIAMIMLRHVNGDTGDCYPGTAKLAKLAKCSQQTVEFARKELKKHGYLDWAHTYNPEKKAYDNNRYTWAWNKKVSLKQLKEVETGYPVATYDPRIREHTTPRIREHTRGTMLQHAVTDEYNGRIKQTKLTTSEKEEGLREEGPEAPINNDLSKDKKEVDLSKQASIEVKLSKDDFSTNTSSATLPVARPAPTPAEMEAAFEQVCLLHPGYQEKYDGACAKKFAELVKAGAAPDDILKAAEVATSRIARHISITGLIKASGRNMQRLMAARL